MSNLVVRFVAAVVLGLTCLVAGQEVLYAAELPGDGFTASVLTILVVLLQFVVQGHRRAAMLLPARWFFRALGVGAIALAALLAVPLAWGAPLLTTLKLPVGALAVSSTTLFDVALYLMVSGGMLYAFTHLEEEPR